MRKFHLSKKWGGQGPPGPPVAATAVNGNKKSTTLKLTDRNSTAHGQHTHITLKIDLI